MGSGIWDGEWDEVISTTKDLGRKEAIQVPKSSTDISICLGSDMSFGLYGK